jgi:hypothetical protein
LSNCSATTLAGGASTAGAFNKWFAMVTVMVIGYGNGNRARARLII